ncbi:MAG: hypothetical protein F6K30_19000 [Cyanothece sp. SIO2G6]|nr:hypothetical protein [Cyanothece sp. SIO2G6]
MSHDVTQWLNEIRALQERISCLDQERAKAAQQASRWYQAYQTEAKQRRADVKRLQHQMNSLVAENQRLKQRSASDSSPIIPPPPPTVPSQGNPIVGAADAHQQDSLKALQQQLIEAIAKCDRLAQTLRQEQRDHAQTRQALMEALSDTIEQLERERAHQTPPTNTRDTGQAARLPAAAKSPRPGLPPQPLVPTQPSSGSGNV